MNELQSTKDWLKDFVIKLNLCPFAKRPFEQDKVHFALSEASDNESLLIKLLTECERLDNTEGLDTTLLVLPALDKSFDDYLDFIALAEDFLSAQDYDGVYQIASFHPQYCFAGNEVDALDNFTNRSPHAMVHIIREAQLERMIAAYGDTSEIPKRNIELLTANA